jgi:putative endonuclease
VTDLVRRLFRRLAAPTDSTAIASTRASGAEAERLAQQHLEQAGLKLRERNYRSPFGEIDLVMEHGDTLVFVEVRMRARPEYGAPAETVDHRKQGRLRRTAEHYLQREPRTSNRPCRFDIVAITQTREGERLEWLRDAF